MNSTTIDASMKPLFQKLEETGILFDRDGLTNLIRRSQKKLVEKIQAINREVGFAVNLNSDVHWDRAMDRVKGQDSPLPEQWIEATRLRFLIRKFLQVYDLANGNYVALGRKFGLYPKYGLDHGRKIVTTSEFSISDLPEEVLGVVSYPGMMLIKATYPEIVPSDFRELSGDPWIIEATAMDLIKVGFANLFEDYRIGKIGCQVFAVTSCSIYLFAPDIHADLISSVVRECLEVVHPDFALPVDVTMGISLDKLV